MRIVSTLTAGAVLLALPALAADTFPNIEYTAGKSGFNENIKGSLVVDDKEIKFTDKKGNTVFSIPITDIVSAGQSREHEEGSFGRKMMLGVFASKNAEYLRVETKNSSGAEVVVFKTKKEQSPGIAAKINYHRENAKGSKKK